MFTVFYFSYYPTMRGKFLKIVSHKIDSATGDFLISIFIFYLPLRLLHHKICVQLILYKHILQYRSNFIISFFIFNMYYIISVVIGTKKVFVYLSIYINFKIEIIVTHAL
jgi:hypothetical protein